MVGYAEIIRYQPLPETHSYRQWGGGLCDQPTDPAFGLRTIGWWGMTETISHPIVGDLHVPARSMSMGGPAPAYGGKVGGARAGAGGPRGKGPEVRVSSTASSPQKLGESCDAEDVQGSGGVTLAVQARVGDVGRPQ